MTKRQHPSIVVMNADGSQRSVLFHDAEKNALAPVWSPQGDKIAFALGRFFQAAQGRASARGGFKDDPALHPYYPQPYGEIYVMRADGSDVRMLTDNQFEEATPSWVPMRRKRSKESEKPNRQAQTF